MGYEALTRHIGATYTELEEPITIRRIFYASARAARGQKE